VKNENLVFLWVPFFIVLFTLMLRGNFELSELSEICISYVGGFLTVYSYYVIRDVKFDKCEL